MSFGRGAGKDQAADGVATSEFTEVAGLAELEEELASSERCCGRLRLEGAGTVFGADAATDGF